MLPVYILSKYNIRPINGALFQWLNITVRLYSSSSSSSSSSDSSDSDSDSDSEKVKSKNFVKNTTSTMSDNKDNLKSFLNNMIQQTVSTKLTKDTRVDKNIRSENLKQEVTTTTATIGLTEYVNNMMKARKLQKTIDVALPPKIKSKNQLNKTKHMSYEKKLANAAENVANMLGGDKTKTTSDLLQKVLASRVETLKKEQLANANLKDISSQDEQETNNRYTEKKSIIHSLLKEYNDKQSVPDHHKVENSVTNQLVNKKTSATQLENNNLKRPHIRKDIDLWDGEPSRIFENIGSASENVPELKTWTTLEQRELKALMTYPPANIFQELILWTEQGKLWKFPIDNEQGMEEEQNVHFSEHVFMERHLKEWCPKSGPVCHFMELVCIGLSKNPYLTVQEKINHIIWYKDFFKSKQNLLQELGAIQEPFPDKVKEITE